MFVPMVSALQKFYCSRIIVLKLTHKRQTLVFCYATCLFPLKQGDGFEGHTTSTISEAGSGSGTNNLNLNGSKAYQEMQRETLMSPVQEDFDDNDSLDDLLGGGGGGHKTQSPA